jgi:diguanylate cyclase (GGDEF)-like protein
MANLRVLIADDDAQVRTLAQRVLTQQGYFVVPASDGGEALTHLQNNSLDVVVTAVNLPKHDGMEILRAAREKTHPVPVILLADASDIGPAANGVRAGAFDYLVKPLHDLTQLALLIDRAAGQHAAPQRTTNPVPSANLPAPSAIEKPASLLDILVQKHDLNVLLNEYAIELARATRAVHTFVLLPHSDGQLHLTASHGFTTPVEVGQMYSAIHGETFAVRIAAARSMKWLQHQDEGVTHYTLGIPLLFQQRVMGIAIAHETAPTETFSPAMLASIQELTHQAAVGIELARLAARTARLEPLDPVTGLFSRDHFLEIADRDFRRAWRFDQTMCAIVMDIDNFGNLHLTLGPQETDQVMRRVANSVREHVRKVDAVGRLNPHTIGLSLWMARKEHGLLVAERLRLLVAEIQVNTPDDTWQITASFGVAAYRSTITSVFDLFGIADQALRAAKRAGGNRVEGV